MLYLQLTTFVAKCLHSGRRLRRSVIRCPVEANWETNFSNLCLGVLETRRVVNSVTLTLKGNALIGDQVISVVV